VNFGFRELQAWHKPEHRMWTPEEWFAQPTAPKSEDEEEEGGDTPALAIGSGSAVAKPDAEDAAPEPALDATVTESSATSGAREAVGIATATNSEAARMREGEQTGCGIAEDAAPMLAAAPATVVTDPLVPAADSAVDNTAAAQRASAVLTPALDEQTAARMADVGAADQSAGAAVLAAHQEQACAPAARAAPAPKGLTVKERLAACIATERHRITFGKVRSSAACKTEGRCCWGS
jgi:hypothetical protein